MLSIKLINISKDYHLLIDGEIVDLKAYGTTGIFNADLSKGKHRIQIKKDKANERFRKIFVKYLFSSLTSSDDENVAKVKGYHKSIDIIFEIDVVNDNAEIIFDGEANKIVFCSEKHTIISEKLEEDTERRKKVRKCITWPVIIGVLLLLLPLLILSILMMISSFDVPSLLLFIIVSALLFFFLLKIKDFFP